MTAVAAALIPAAAARSAWRRWGVAAYGCIVELGARGLVARSSAPGGVVVAAGEPGAGPIPPQVLNHSVWETGPAVRRSEWRPWESGGGVARTGCARWRTRVPGRVSRTRAAAALAR